MTATTAHAKTLSSELAAKLLRRLGQEWEELNWQLFGSKMRSPIFELLEGEARLGEWHAHGRRLLLSRNAVLERPWAETIEVLKHEMAHQYVDEVLGGEPRPHGPKFRQVCEARGIDKAATGVVDASVPATTAEDKIIERVRKLLALAESSNQHEAELAASTAQRIMLKHNLEVQRRPGSETPQHLWVGNPTGRVPAHERNLASLLPDHFFVQGIWIPIYRPLEGKTGSVLELCGRPENLQMAEFVHGFVLRTIDRLWQEHKAAHGIRSNRDRRTFLSGAVTGFATKLREKQSSARQEGLVWAGDPAIDDYLHRRYPRTATVRYSETRDRAAYHAGRSAGRDIVLSRPMTSTAQDAAPRALPRGRE